MKPNALIARKAREQTQACVTQNCLCRSQPMPRFHSATGNTGDRDRHRSLPTSGVHHENNKEEVYVMQSQAETMEPADRHIVDSFRADNIQAPFAIILIKSVIKICDGRSKISEYVIPDMQDLLNSIVLYRTIDKCKLRGPDIKFLRKCLGLRAAELSKKMSISREHFSRCENENVPISNSLETLLRIFVLKIITSKLDSNLIHRNITLNSGIDAIFGIENEKRDLSASSEFALNLRRISINGNIRRQENSTLDHAWIKADSRQSYIAEI